MFHKSASGNTDRIVRRERFTSDIYSDARMSVGLYWNIILLSTDHETMILAPKRCPISPCKMDREIVEMRFTYILVVPIGLYIIGVNERSTQ